MFSGFVLGYLFPSLWRAFRRTFFKRSQYLSLPLIGRKAFLSPDWIESKSQLSEHLNAHRFKIFDLMNFARFSLQSGDFRRAVEIYIHLLKRKNITSSDIHHVLYELSFVYAQLRIYSFAFDAAFELLCHSKTNAFYFEHCLDLISKEPTLRHLNLSLEQYRGSFPADLCRKIATLYVALAKKEHRDDKKRELLQSALTWFSKEGEALELLWECHYLKNLKGLVSNPNVFLSELSTALIFLSNYQKEISQSLTSLGQKLFEVLKLFGENPSLQGHFKRQKKYFSEKFSPKKLSEELQESFSTALLYAYLLYEESSEALSAESIEEFLLFFGLASPRTEGLKKKKTQMAKALFTEALALHKCSSCGAIRYGFFWSCPSCQSRHSSFPVFSLESYVNPR